MAKTNLKPPTLKGTGGYPDMITPITEPLQSGDPRVPVNNPSFPTPPDPLGYLKGKGKG